MSAQLALDAPPRRPAVSSAPAPTRDPGARRTAQLAAAVFLVACGVRLAALGLSGWELRPGQLWGDAPQYQDLATNMVEGRGYTLEWAGVGPRHGKLQPTALRPPALPAVLAATYAVTGPSPTTGRLVLVLVDSLTCALLVVLGTRLASRRIGVLAGLIAAAYPPLWAHVLSLWSEPVFTLGIVVALLMALRHARSPSIATGAGLGVVLGLVALSRPNGFGLGLVLAAWAAWSARGLGRRRLALTGAACLAGMALVVTPWEVRTARAMGTVVPITTDGGPVLGGDYSSPVLDTSSPVWGWWDANGVIDAVVHAPSEIEADRQLRERGMRWLVHHPGGDVELVGLRTVRYFDLYWSGQNRKLLRFPSQWSGLNAAAVLAWWAVAFLALVGLRDLWRKRQLGPWAPALLAWATLAAGGVLLAAATRYRVPSDPIVLLLAAAGISALTNSVMVRRGRRHYDPPVARL